MGSSRSERRVVQMLDAMIHRGPDQHGVWQNEYVVLGHRRLSILDVSETGRQPMTHGPSKNVLVYNGEIYNFVELRDELVKLGHRFESSGDTAVLLAALTQWGTQALSKLRGMFTIALFNPETEELMLARDRVGIKPVYYRAGTDCFEFASEIRALIRGRSNQRLDRSSLDAYLWHGFIPGPSTIVEDVKLLEPGTAITINKQGKIKCRFSFWQIPKSPKVYGPVRDSVAEAKKELYRAVEMRLVSDVPLGVFLSGGVDSSVVTAIAQQASSRPVDTFNISFSDSRYDESPFARTVAEHLGTNHHEIMLGEHEFLEGLDSAMGSLDQPSFDALNTYFVSKAVKQQGLTVALSGTGGDELFGGYTSFADLPKARSLNRIFAFSPVLFNRALVNVAKLIEGGINPTVSPQTRWGKLGDVLDAGTDLAALYQVSCAQFTRETLTDLVRHDRSELNWGLSADVFSELQNMIVDEPALSAVSKLELWSFVTQRLLRDTDTTSMSSSIEVRVPLLDHLFVERVAEIHPQTRFHPLRSKDLLKEMCDDLLPRSFFDRPKAGFELPLQEWCKVHLRDQISSLLTERELVAAVGLNPEAVANIWSGFVAGQKGLYWSRIWGLYSLIDWCRRNEVYAN